MTNYESIAERRYSAPIPGPDKASELRLGDILIDREGLRVTLDGRPLSLTLQEFELLNILATSAGKPVSQEELADALWPVQGKRGYQRHISVLIARLRTKLRGSGSYQLATLRKRGYALIPLLSNRIEQIKLAKDGLDVFDDILRYAQTGAEPDPDDIERMKWYGLFYRRQTPGFFMLRLRAPNGVLTSEQLSTLGELSNTYGRGLVDITTRQNLQLRWLRIRDVPAIFRRLDEVGLEFRQSGMDNVRNITGCPMAGLDPSEVLDASAIARDLQNTILGRKEFSNLPRKFNISISGCRHDCATSQIHDLSLVPSIKDGKPGFNVLVGGAMGSKSSRFAEDLGVFVAPEDAVSFCLAVVELFRDEGSRDNRQTARLGMIVDQWGIDRLRAEIEKRYHRMPAAGDCQRETFAGDHIGVIPQKQPNLYSVGCLIPVGRVGGDDLIELGRLARQYGSGEVRLTNNQNALIVNVASGGLASLLKEPLLDKFSPAPPNWSRRVVSCTGKDFCHFALIDTKSRAVELSESMRLAMPDTMPLRVHWSGCSHGCGQHLIADIGLQASRVAVGNEIVDAADVFIGGRPGDEPRLARKVLDAVPLDQLPARLSELLGTGALQRS